MIKHPRIYSCLPAGYIKAAFLMVMLFTFFCPWQSRVYGNARGDQPEYILFSNHRTSYCIWLGAQASPSEKWAAKELHHWLEQISGADFPILQADQSGTTAASGPRIILGYNELVKAKLNIPLPAPADESFRYLSEGGDIMIFGGRERGTLYGVMAFLENELGCRWYTPAVSVIPPREELRFSHYDRTESPGVRVRNDFYFEAFDTLWAARNRMNGRMGYVNQPGGVEAYWAVHTFYPLVPPDEFFGKHPEYYSLVNGKRTHESAQLCLTNPHVLSIIIDRIKKRMRESPEYLIYDVSQNDNFNPCQCDKCQRIVREEQSESGLIIWFVNQVAAAVEKEFPDKYIGTLAYQYTRTPPRNIRPRANVVVRLCPIEACVAHDLKSCPQNQSFMHDLLGWSSLAPHLYIWDYVVNFSNYVMPYPNIQVLQSNIQTFRDNHAIGIMEQAAYQSRGGEFAELKSYLISKLLWNPEANTEDIIRDFMDGYYGRSGRYIRAYLNLLQARITPQTHMHIGITPQDSLFTDDLVTSSLKLFEQAKTVADNEDIFKRVEMASLPILFLHCMRSPAAARNDGSYQTFLRVANREKVLYYKEADANEVERDRRQFMEQVEKAN